MLTFTEIWQVVSESFYPGCLNCYENRLNSQDNDLVSALYNSFNLTINFQLKKKAVMNVPNQTYVH